MPLQVRRGSSSERLSIIPADGELVWDQTEKTLYVGDGIEEGGLISSGIGFTDTDAILAVGEALNNGVHTGISFSFNNTSISATLTDVNAELLSGTANISIESDDENTILVNSLTKEFSGTSAIFTTIQGSILSDDGSTILVDPTLQTFQGASAVFGDVEAVRLIGSVYDASDNIVVDVLNSTLRTDLAYHEEITVTDDAGNTSFISGGGLTLNISQPEIIGITVSTDLGPNASGDVFKILTHHNESESNELTFLRTRGSAETPTPVIASDKIFNFSFFGQAADDISFVASIIVSADENGTIGSTVIPGKIEFQTTNDIGDTVTNLSIDKDGIIGFADNTLSAGSGSGEVDISSVITYLKVNVGGTDYAIPLYAINP